MTTDGVNGYVQKIVALLSAKEAHKNRAFPSSARVFVTSFVTTCTLLFFTSTSYAQGPSGASAAVALLPSNDSADIPSLTIQSSNASQFRSLIPPELYALVKEGSLQLVAAKSLHYTPALDEQWLKLSAGHFSDSVDVEKSAFKDRITTGGFVFGPGSEFSLDTPAEELGYKLLWNTESLWWSRGVLDATLEINEIQDQKIAHSFRAKFTRLYRSVLGQSAGSDQLFREVLRFERPELLKPMAFLTFRSLGADEDTVWLYSSALKKTRQLTGSNRTDPMLRTLISLDDLLLWSGKGELIEPTSVKQQYILSPFASTEMSELVASDNGKCLNVKEPMVATASREDEQISSTDAAFSLMLSSRVPLPAGTVFVPRPVLKVEFSPKDPFATHGRIILYVDSDLMVPVAKVVFDRAGQISKIGLAAYGVAASAETGQRFVYPSFVAFTEEDAKRTSLIRFSGARFCKEVPSDVDASSMDPSHLGPMEAVATPTPAPKKKK